MEDGSEGSYQGSEGCVKGVLQFGECGDLTSAKAWVGRHRGVARQNQDRRA